MLTPRLTNCQDCHKIPDLLKQIDCKLAELANDAYNDVVFMLGNCIPAYEINQLLAYKRILTFKYCNPHYAGCVSVNDIAGKVIRLTSGCISRCNKPTVCEITTCYVDVVPNPTTTTTTTSPIICGFSGNIICIPPTTTTTTTTILPDCRVEGCFTIPTTTTTTTTVAPTTTTTTTTVAPTTTTTTTTVAPTTTTTTTTTSPIICDFSGSIICIPPTTTTTTTTVAPTTTTTTTTVAPTTTTTSTTSTTTTTSTTVAPTTTTTTSTTTPILATVTTEGSSVTTNSGTINGSFVENSETVSDYGFFWATHANPTQADNIVPPTTGFISVITGLSCGIQYYYRAWIKTVERGSTYIVGNVKTFTTTACACAGKTWLTNVRHSSVRAYVCNSGAGDFYVDAPTLAEGSTIYEGYDCEVIASPGYYSNVYEVPRTIYYFTGVYGGLAPATGSDAGFCGP